MPWASPIFGSFGTCHGSWENSKPKVELELASEASSEAMEADGGLSVANQAGTGRLLAMGEKIMELE